MSAPVVATNRLRAAARAGCLLLALLGLITVVTEFSLAPTDVAFEPRPIAHSGHGGSFQFVAYGDIEEENLGFADLMQLAGDRAAPDFGVVLGDVAKRSTRERESYIEFAEVVARLRPPYPIFAVPGNHDRADAWMPDEFVRAFGPLNWWFVHEHYVFVGLDNSLGRLTKDAAKTLEEAGEAAPDARGVVVFLHMPLYGAAVVGDGTAEARNLAKLRAALGDIDLVLSGHADIWTDDVDDEGTRHVCVGAEPGFGWPEEASTPQLAALCSVTPEGVGIEQLRVPYRQEALASVRQFAHLQIVLRVRRWLGPVPVWLLTLLAYGGWHLLRRRQR